MSPFTLNPLRARGPFRIASPEAALEATEEDGVPCGCALGALILSRSPRALELNDDYQRGFESGFDLGYEDGAACRVAVGA